jgi:hypothetical protein
MIGKQFCLRAIIPSQCFDPSIALVGYCSTAIIFYKKIDPKWTAQGVLNPGLTLEIHLLYHDSPLVVGKFSHGFPTELGC